MKPELKNLLDRNSERTLSRISQDEVLQVKAAIAEFVGMIEISQNNPEAQSLMDVRFGVAHNTILHLAAKFGEEKSVEKIIAKSEKINGFDIVNLVNDERFSPLHFAAIQGDLKIVKVLIAAGAEKNAAVSEKRRNWTAIHFAAQFNHVEVVKFLVEIGVNTEIKTGFGLTPLVVAAEFGSNQVLEFLLSVRASKNVQTIDENHKMTALHYAAIGDFNKTAAILLNAGIDKDKETDRGFTALDFAAKNNLAEMVVLLMSYGVDGWEKSLRIAQENKSQDAINQIKKYQKSKAKLFNLGDLSKIERSVLAALKSFNMNNLGEAKVILEGGVAFNAFGIVSLSHVFGLFSKEKKPFISFIIQNGLTELERELKRLIALIESNNRMYK